MPIQCKPVHYEGDLSSFKWETHHKINTSLLMLREWTYTASSRDALGNTSPSALEISLGRGFCTPRPSRLPSGFALGQSLGPRGAKSPPSGNLSGLGGCISQYIPPLGSVRIHPGHIHLIILINIIIIIILQVAFTSGMKTFCQGIFVCNLFPSGRPWTNCQEDKLSGYVCVYSMV